MPTFLLPVHINWRTFSTTLRSSIVLFPFRIAWWRWGYMCSCQSHGQGSKSPDSTGSQRTSMIYGKIVLCIQTKIGHNMNSFYLWGIGEFLFQTNRIPISHYKTLRKIWSPMQPTGCAPNSPSTVHKTMGYPILWSTNLTMFKLPFIQQKLDLLH